MTSCHMAVQALGCLEIHVTQFTIQITHFYIFDFLSPLKRYFHPPLLLSFLRSLALINFPLSWAERPTASTTRTVLIVSNCFLHSLSLSHSSLVIDAVFSLEPCAGGSGMMFWAKLPPTTSFLSNLSITSSFMIVLWFVHSFTVQLVLTQILANIDDSTIMSIHRYWVKEQYQICIFQTQVMSEFQLLTIVWPNQSDPNGPYWSQQFHKYGVTVIVIS